MSDTEYSVIKNDVIKSFDCSITFMQEHKFTSGSLYTENRLTAYSKLAKEKCGKVNTGPRSAVGNMSGYRCEADCRSRGREFDPGPVPYFRGD